MHPVLDVFTLLIFLGVIQGVFLSAFFIGRGGENPIANRMLGFLLLSLSAVIFEILLQYSGYITKVVHLVNFSEPLDLAIGPLAYLAAYAGVRRLERLDRRQYLHFLPFVLYAIYCVPYFIAPAAYKYNTFLDAYHPDQPYTAVNVPIHPDPLGLRSHVNEMMMVQLAVYCVLTIGAVRSALRSRGLGFLSRVDPGLSHLRTLALQFAIITVALFVVKATFEADVGDYILASLVTILIYTVSYVVIRGSAFFSGPAPAGMPRPKYERSSLTGEMSRNLVDRLNRLMSDEKPHLDNSVSLPDLASRLSVSPHHLSQVLNEQLQQTFFEFVAAHRVAEAKRILSSPGAANLKIEEVAERVGYYSKSAFNTAFKRITGLTPSSFRDQLSRNSASD
jgi:AraC-like DNA-binding protein